MNRTRAKELLPVIQAFAEGKEIVATYEDGSTQIVQEPSFQDNVNYAVKPYPQYRPWTSDEVPLGGIIRTKGSPNDRFVVTSNTCGIGYGRDEGVSYEDALRDMEHYLGGCWLPCGVEISDNK